MFWKTWGCCLLLLLSAGTAQADGAVFSVRLDPSVQAGPATGRVIVAVSREMEGEPRRSIGLNGPVVVGRDVEALQPGVPALLGTSDATFPLASLGALPPGEYTVQALLITYEQVNRADGKQLWLPFTDRRISILHKPGNLHSAPARVRLPARDGRPVELMLDHTIPPLEPLEDTPWIKRVRIRSEILSAHWGRPVHIGASVLLPAGFHDEPERKYPSVVVFGHGDTPFGFNTDPASRTEAAIEQARDANVETGYDFYRAWSSPDFPRVVAITFEHPSPYFVESYAVDSANNGPYGRAFIEEVYPYLEREFRLIASPHARILEGASTGGWEALAMQLHYPDFFGGAWVFNPDPIDFRRYLVGNIYQDTNMFTFKVNDWITAERPFRRSREGQPLLTMRHLAGLENVLGSRGRSGYQLDIWQATHGPMDSDGYPRLLFDKVTGEIDPEVAAYMRDRGYDLGALVLRDWDRLGPKLRGKLHLFAGEMDDFYLNLAVYQFEDALRSVAGDDYPARFEYGRPGKGHNWHHTDWAGVVREMAAHVEKNSTRTGQGE